MDHVMRDVVLVRLVLREGCVDQDGEMMLMLSSDAVSIEVGTEHSLLAQLLLPPVGVHPLADGLPLIAVEIVLSSSTASEEENDVGKGPFVGTQ